MMRGLILLMMIALTVGCAERPQAGSPGGPGTPSASAAVSSPGVVSSTASPTAASADRTPDTLAASTRSPISSPTSTVASSHSAEPTPDPDTTQPEPSASASATWTPWPSGEPPPPQHTTCGDAVVRDLPPTAVSFGGKALRCFAAAVRDCRPASVHVVHTGVDSGLEFVASIEGGSPCRTSYAYNQWTANFEGLTGPTTTVNCTVRATSTLLHFACPNVTDDVPLPAAT